MSSVRKETIEGFNKLLSKQKQLRGEAKVSLALFNDTVRFVYESLPMTEAPLLGFADYIPNGGTALNDAIGRTIQAIGRQATRLTPVLVTIITDGGDTNSCEFTAADIRQMVSYRRRSHDWEFIFLGPENARSYVSKIGIPPDCIFSFEAGADGIIRLLEGLSLCLADYRSGEPKYLTCSPTDELIPSLLEQFLI
jgi:uncharacterized protein YegL